MDRKAAGCLGVVIAVACLGVAGLCVLACGGLLVGAGSTQTVAVRPSRPAPPAVVVEPPPSDPDATAAVDGGETATEEEAGHQVEQAPTADAAASESKEGAAKRSLWEKVKEAFRDDGEAEEIGSENSAEEAIPVGQEFTPGVYFASDEEQAGVFERATRTADFTSLETAIESVPELDERGSPRVVAQLNRELLGSWLLTDVTVEGVAPPSKRAENPNRLTIKCATVKDGTPLYCVSFEEGASLLRRTLEKGDRIRVLGSMKARETSEGSVSMYLDPCDILILGDD